MAAGSLRVVAGVHGGRRIRAPAGGATRPTADRVREALFSMLGDVSELRVLDLFAGSGALGIEALSRGAAEAVFVDRGPRSVAAIHANLALLGLEAAVHSRDVLAFLADAGGVAGFDLVLCDPPYDAARPLAAPLAERLPALLTEDACIVTESDKRAPLDLPFPLMRERTYGDTRIAIHRVR